MHCQSVTSNIGAVRKREWLTDIITHGTEERTNNFRTQ